MGERAVARAWARKVGRVVWEGGAVVEVVRRGGLRFRGRGERRRRGRRVMRRWASFDQCKILRTAVVDF